MIRLVRAEFLKFRSTQVWFWLLLAALGVAALGVIGSLAPSNSDIRTPDDVAQMFAISGFAYIVVFVLGVLGVTTEFRYQTITQTVLATPSRWAIVTAKLITYAVLGALYAIACLLVQLAIALPWLSAKGVDWTLTGHHVPRTLLSVFAVVALFGIVGLGIGALLRNQIVAVSVGVVFFLVLENLIVAIPGVKHIYPYLPGGAARALLIIKASDRHINGITLFGPLGGVIVLLLWAFVPALLGARLTLTRDIT
ncbi:MAG: ABC transporter permease [Jatrophihabitans sp.]|uniref:ABC transporter permease n=1 Tax=Jatrophihabitans sp. TaxID=1932789 RepID=UPI003F7EEA5A